ncbi:sodium/hydrogen exchanger 6, partial [Tanacetum coccineum]
AEDQHLVIKEKRKSRLFSMSAYSLLGIVVLISRIAKCGARAPLNIVSWKSMPDTNLDLMWRDVQTNAPEDYKDNCLKLIGGHWKKWKSIVKHDFFTPNKDDPEKLLIPPSDTRVNPEQWPNLVNYWQRDDVQVNIRADNKALFCSIIYADNYYVAQRALWNNFVGHASLICVINQWVKLGVLCIALLNGLKGLKTPLRKHLHDQGDLHNRVNRLRMELDEAQKAIDRNPSYSLLCDEHAHYLLSFKEGSLDKERFLRQKSKIEWLNARDANTAYFYRIVKTKCARNRIEMFLGLEGASTPLDDQGLFTWVLAKSPWDIVGGEITNAVRDFFSNGKLLKELNHTIISLISKVSTLAKINDYRPISYCKVLFKCISKIIANRIKEDLGDLVSINQSAFVLGRRILDNILLTQELMRNYHRKRGPPRCAFKVDIQKAYDTVDWRFLRSILVGFGFHPTMVEWIMVCVSTTSYSVCINGDMYGWFNGANWKDFPDFKNVSGLVPSIPKSTAFFCIISNAVKASILSSMSFAEDTLLFKYLGVRLISYKLLYRDCKFNPRSLGVSYGAKWEMKKGKAKVAWEAVCLPHREGGLGIRRLDDFNVALMTTHIWCILINKESLWVQWIYSYKLKGRSFWDVPCLGDVSWGWRKLLHIRTRIRPFIWHKINNGRSTSMWFDRWVDSCPLRDMLTVRNIVRSGFSLSDTVSDLISNGSWRWPHDWSSRFLNVVDIPVLDINNDLDDVIIWRDVRGVCAFTGMSYVPPRLVDVIAFLIPSKGSLVSNVISRIVLATMTYCLWNERNSGLFKKGRIDCDQIVQMIPLGANESSVAFQDQEDDNPVFPIGFSLMKAKKEDLYRANMFIKMRTANNGKIPDEDTRIVVEKLNEVPQSEQTDSFKEQVFIDLVGSDGHGSVKTFGGGVSSRKVFGPRSSLMNTTSSHAIERMVQAQVAAQLEAKVAERIANIVADQDAQIEAKVAAHVSNHEKAQMEWFKKLELLLGRELPPPPSYHAHRSGSSLVRDYNEDVFR